MKELTVEAILDLRNNPTAEPIHAESYLAALSEAEYSNLRADATRTRKTDQPALRCGDCRQAVYVRESPQHRRHCYHVAGDHSDCIWAGAVAQSVDHIDGFKFHGQQEGERHKHICQLLQEVVSLDASSQVAGVTHRRYTKLLEQYAYPDIYTSSWQGGPAAFEVQLSTTQLPTIIRREDFYRAAGIRLCWVTGFDGAQLARRAFLDIYMRNDGQILAMDGEVAAIAKEARAPRFRLCRLLPGKAELGFAPRWRDKIVQTNDMNWGHPGEKPRSSGPSYDEYLDLVIQNDPTLSLLREEFYRSLESGDAHAAKDAWDGVVDIVGGQSWQELPSSYDTIRALGVLATVRLGRLCVPTALPPSHLIEIANSILLEPAERRIWTHALMTIFNKKGFSGLLSARSVKQKCDRNVAEFSKVVPIERQAGPVYNVFFPEGAFDRIDLNV